MKRPWVASHPWLVTALLAGSAILAGAAGWVWLDPPCGGTTRTYYVAAEDAAWDYAPLGYNGLTRQPFDGPALTYVAQDADRIGHVYTKALYRGYTDETFTIPLQRPTDQQHMGLLGPVLRAEVGDSVRIVFRNLSSIPATLHPHGVAYDQTNEGMNHGAYPAGVAPGETATYTWSVPPRAGPAGEQGSSRVWLYHSHADEPRDVNAGLVGPIVVTACGKATASGAPKDVDQEVFTYFSVIDENDSPYLEANIRERLRPRDPVDRMDPGFVESNLKHAINGYLYGNLPGIDLHKGERVRWYILALGSEVDLHTAHWHGNVVNDGDTRTDVASLLPASMATVDMRPDQAGTWMLHCHVHDHMDAGMAVMYRVTV